MSKKGTIEVFQTKISRNDRFAQMSHQEKLIEQKKREIQAKLEQKQKTQTSEGKTAVKNKSSPIKVQEKPEKKAFNFNTFSNDGSFLNQFKQMKEKKLEHKLKSFKSRDVHDRYSSDERNKKWKRDQTKNDRVPKVRTSRFSDKPPNFEPKINISTSYSNLIAQQNFDGQSMVTAQDVTGQPLLQNLVAQNVQYPLSPPNTASVIAAPPILLNVPPPQLQLQAPMVLPPPASIEMTVDLCPTTVITTVTLPQAPLPPQTIVENSIITVPPPCMPTIELASIPPPNPIQVHNIPQPEPINTLTIPPPAPLQVQNIPPPSPIQLNEIPNPKPMDILSIPTPNEAMDKNISDPDFIKNIPPPNKSVPPPNLPEPMNVTLPPPPPTKTNQAVPTCIPPPNIMPPTSMPPPPQNLLIPPPVVNLTNPQPLPPPPQIQLQTVLQQSLSVMNMQTIQPVPNPIPPLMAQPILPPPGMGIVPPPINMSCPPPHLNPPPSFINQPPPNQLINIAEIVLGAAPIKDANIGSADYEAMASLGRMVAQCGPGIEDIVRLRKNQDPSLWFLFHKESAAYQQYQQLVEQFRSEMECCGGGDYRPEDIYEPDCVDDDDLKMEDEKKCMRRKRKSRWGQNDEMISSPGVVIPNSPRGSGMLSKITRSDPGLIQYAVTTFGSTNISEEDWKKAEDHYKINMLYQDMLRKREQLERLEKRGHNQYAYDSDEDTDGGTWEHKLRDKEMVATQLWATELNRQAEGKHHIGDFLPPEEFKKFMEKSQAARDGKPLDVSDYKEFKLKEDNVGFKMMQKLGWSEGQGLGTDGQGMLEPINKGSNRDSNQGLGIDQPDSLDTNDDEYDAYRKRMMLAYRFRPNPLNNPRRPYY